MISTGLVDNLRHALTRVVRQKHFPLLLLLFCIASIDYSKRLSLNADFESYQGTSDESLTVLFPQKMTDAAYSVYLARLTSSVKEEVSEKNLDNEEIPSQQPTPVPGSWNTSSNSYTLIGTFIGIDSFAVLDSYNKQTQESKLVEVRKGEILDGFSVMSIRPKTIEVGNQSEGTVTLEMFRSPGEGTVETMVGNER